MLYYWPHVLQMKFQRKLDFFEKTILEDVRYVNRWCIDSGDSSIHGKGDLRQCETAGAGFENSCAAEVFLPGSSARPLGRGQPWWWEVVCPLVGAVCPLFCVMLGDALVTAIHSDGVLRFDHIRELSDTPAHAPTCACISAPVHAFIHVHTNTGTHTHTHTHSCPCSHTYYYQVSDECVSYLSLRFLFVHEEHMDLLGDTCWHCYSQSRCMSPVQLRLLKAFLHLNSIFKSAKPILWKVFLHFEFHLLVS